MTELWLRGALLVALAVAGLILGLYVAGPAGAIATAILPTIGGIVFLYLDHRREEAIASDLADARREVEEVKREAAKALREATRPESDREQADRMRRDLSRRHAYGDRD